MNRFFGTTGRLRPLASAAACLALAALAGCGDGGKATVGGRVTYKGAPVTGGTLLLYPASGPPYPIGIKADGAFNVSDVPVGQMGVTIDTDSVPTVPGYSAPPNMKDKATAEAPQGDAINMAKRVAIPPKYKDPKTSGLTWDIKGGKNTKDFDLTD